MAEERYTFAQARTRLEEIVVQVRKKDTSLEKSLDLLEEGVRLANACTELSDHTEWRTVAGEVPEAGTPADEVAVLTDDTGASESPEDDHASVDQDSVEIVTPEADHAASDEAGSEPLVDADGSDPRT